jgi:hypothetical protein
MAGAILARWKTESAGHVEHAEILGGVVLVRQHVDNEREVDGHVYAEAESAQGHAEEKTVEVAGDGDHEHRRAVHDRCGEYEDFLRPVRSESLPPMREAAMTTADWTRVPRNICCGTSALVLPIFSSR